MYHLSNPEKYNLVQIIDVYHLILLMLVNMMNDYDFMMSG